MATPLEKAKFTLVQLDPEGKGSYLSGGISKSSDLTGSDGSTSISDITDGYYEISETKTPDGYVLIDSGKFYIHVDNGNISLLTPDTSKVVTAWENRTLTNEDKLVFDAIRKTITVGNTPGSALPSSGGPGTWTYILFGGALSVIAFFLLRNRRLKPLRKH